MGVVGILGVALGAVQTVMTVREQRRAQRAATTRNSIRRAQGEINNRAARRRLAREERIKRGRIRNAAINSGAGVTSGLNASLASLSNQFDQNIGNQEANLRAERGVGQQNMIIARAESRIQTYQAIGQTVQAGLGAINEAGKGLGG